MKRILSTQDRSLAESLRIALEAAGIETVSPSNLAMAAHAPVTVTIVRDQDYDDAVKLLQNLSRTQEPARIASWFRWPLRLALLLIVISALVFTAEWIFG